MGGETGRFRRSDRLLDGRDFRRVLREGRRRGSAELVVVTASSRRKPRNSEDLSPARPIGAGSRLGITASRKVGNAVVRNRFKRQIREWFRQHRGELPDALDMVVIARRSGAELSFGELDQRMRDLLRLRQAGAGDTPREERR